MTSTSLKATEDKFAGDPEAAKAQPSVVGRLSNGRAALTSGNYTWEADLTPGLGGTGSAPSPTQYLLGALAGCAVAFTHDTLAPHSTSRSTTLPQPHGAGRTRAVCSEWTARSRT